MSASLPLRFARATAFAAVCLILAVAAHLFAGGEIGSWAIFGGPVVAFLAALPLCGRERGMAVILPLLSAVQVALHLMFAAGRTPAEIPAGVHPHIGSGLIPDLGMLVMHGWAVTLTALWLTRGEAALWALIRRFERGLFRLFGYWLALVVDTPGRPGPAGLPAPRVLRSALLRHSLSGRAPPVPQVASG
ncbi:MFS transporter [Rhizohabitans arisaemae]|uniref:MFS transporter n=1 Tax=Rhizohabitans arisaemae TaxID=2720610 RepID=UPI0024B0BF85|nr:MFS transporter [Rhizohabitans arisaemae]